MPEPTSVDAIRAGLKRAREAIFVRAEKYPGAAIFLSQRWEDSSRDVSFQLYRALGLWISASDGLARKSVMEGALQFGGGISVNVCVSAWTSEVIRRGPWNDASDYGLLEGLVWNICIERINHTNINGPGIQGLSDRDQQEIAFLIEAPLREVLDEFASNGRISKLPDNPLRDRLAEEWSRAGQKLAGKLSRGEIDRSHPFVQVARRAFYELGQGVEKLSERRELLSNWQRPGPELTAFHTASANIVQSFDPQRIAALPFDQYVQLPDQDIHGRWWGVRDEPNVRLVLSPRDRDNPNSSRATVEVSGRRIEFDIRDIGFGSLAAHQNKIAAPGKDLHVYMISDPCSTVFPRERLGDGVTPGLVARALRHLHVAALSPQFGLQCRSRDHHHQVFSI